jgi:glucose-1-phosphate cytidylyltransferase
MKVVLFCGGFGMRMREFSDAIPKPMVPIGSRPVLWHLMRYYAHYGHSDFVLCLGYKGDVIKDYFLNYKEWVSNDFVMSRGGANIEMLNRDIDDWRITFVDTGMESNIGERLVAVREHLDGEEMFLANYADGLTDCPLPRIVEHSRAHDSVATFLCVRPSQTFHVVRMGEDSRVAEIQESSRAGLWINGGFFVLRQEIFDYIESGEELVYEPFDRLMKIGRLTGYRHDGFWAGMDTFKDRQQLDDMYTRGGARWEVWRPDREDGLGSA